jgi:hypothetical protein
METMLDLPRGSLNSCAVLQNCLFPPVTLFRPMLQD